MRGSEIYQYIVNIPQLADFFTKISTVDDIPQLDEDQFTIVNTE